VLVLMLCNYELHNVEIKVEKNTEKVNFSFVRFSCVVICFDCPIEKVLKLARGLPCVVG